MCVCVFINANFLMSQEDSKMFLLMAYEDSFDRDTSGSTKIEWNDYKKVLFNIQADTLVAFDTINVEENHSLNRLIHFTEKEFFYFEERNMFNYWGHPDYYSILDYSENKLTIRRVDVENSFNEYKHYSNLLTYLINGEVFIINQAKYDGKLRGIATNRFLNRENVSMIIENNIYRTGRSSPYHYEFAFSYFYPFAYVESIGNRTQSETIFKENIENYNSTLKIITGRTLDKYNEMPDAPVQIPRVYRDSTINRVDLVVSNENYFVVSGYSKIRNIPDSIVEYLWIFDKESNLIDTLNIQNDRYLLKNYNDWLYGTIVEKNRKPYQLDSYTEKERYNRYVQNQKIVEGKYNLKNGIPPFLLDKTGLLILYHIPTKKRIVWDTGELDSEILLIEDDKIYYRVYDEIRRIDLDSHKLNIDRDTDVILVQDKDKVPYIHHIFFSGTKQEKCKIEWVDTMD